MLTILIIYFLGFLYAQNSAKRSIKERLMKLLPCSAAKTTSPVTQSKFYFSFDFDFVFFFFRFACNKIYTFINCLFKREDICWSNCMIYWCLKGVMDRLLTDLSVQSMMARYQCQCLLCRKFQVGTYAPQASWKVVHWWNEMLVLTVFANW